MSPVRPKVSCSELTLVKLEWHWLWATACCFRELTDWALFNPRAIQQGVAVKYANRKINSIITLGRIEVQYLRCWVSKINYFSQWTTKNDAHYTNPQSVTRCSISKTWNEIKSNHVCCFLLTEHRSPRGTTEYRKGNRVEYFDQRSVKHYQVIGNVPPPKKKTTTTGIARANSNS